MFVSSGSRAGRKRIAAAVASGGLRDYFMAHKNAAQNGISLATLVQIEYSVEDVDTGGKYDAANSRWTPAAGPIEIFIGCNFVFSTGGTARLHVVKNADGGAGPASKFAQISECGRATGINPAGVYTDVADGEDTYEFYAFANFEATGCNLGSDPRGSWVYGREL